MRILLLFLLAVIYSSPAWASTSFAVNGWIGKPIYNRDHKLTACEASTTYRGGDKITLIMWANIHISIIYKASKRFRESEVYSVSARIDKKAFFKGYGIGEKTDSLLFHPLATREISSLSLGHSIQIRTQLTPPKRYSLAGSAAALLKLKECINSRNTRPTAPKLRWLTSKQNITALSSIFRIAGITGHTILPPEPRSRFVKFDTVDGSHGIFAAYRDAIDPTLPDRRITDIISSLSKACKNKFLAGKENVPSTDGSLIRKSTTKCDIGNRYLISEALVIQKPNGFAVEIKTMYLVYPNSIPKPDSSIRDGAIVDAVLKSKSLK